MPYEHTATFDHPVESVFAWHSRPGALSRLLPPWQPVSAAQESRSLRDGEAVIRLPGGLKWRARHDPTGYEPGHCFTDTLVTPVLQQLLGWRHTHLFEEGSAGGTNVTDRVQTRTPERFLEEMLAFRTRQLAGDLAALREWHHDGLTVAVTGASGLVGTALSALLSTGGHRVVRLVRGSTGITDAKGSVRHWQPDSPADYLLDGVDAVVHLAGKPIAGQFTAGHKDAVRSSRVGPTRRLAQLAAKSGIRIFVSASAVGYYGPDRGDEELAENSGRGDGFLADLVADWEDAAHEAGTSGGRVVIIRTGVVQSPRGGALKLLRPLFEAGLGGPLAGGRSWMAWIGIDDLADIYLRALVDTSLHGPINATAPEPVRNSDYTRVLARVLHRPAVLPVPRLGPQLLLGAEGAEEVVLASQRVVPTALMRAGHRFRHPDLEGALRHVLGRSLQR